MDRAVRRGLVVSLLEYIIFFTTPLYVDLEGKFYEYYNDDVGLSRFYRNSNYHIPIFFLRHELLLLVLILSQLAFWYAVGRRDKLSSWVVLFNLSYTMLIVITHVWIILNDIAIILDNGGKDPLLWILRAYNFPLEISLIMLSSIYRVYLLMGMRNPRISPLMQVRKLIKRFRGSDRVTKLHIFVFFTPFLLNLMYLLLLMVAYGRIIPRFLRVRFDLIIDQDSVWRGNIWRFVDVTIRWHFRIQLLVWLVYWFLRIRYPRAVSKYLSFPAMVTYYIQVMMLTQYVFGIGSYSPWTLWIQLFHLSVWCLIWFIGWRIELRSRRTTVQSLYPLA